MAKVLDASKLRSRQRRASVVLYVIGGLTLLLGIGAELAHVDVLLKLFGSGWIVASEGLILVVLGYFTMRGSLIALGVAIALYGIDAILTLLAGAIASIGVRALVLFFLIQGFLALRELHRRQGALANPGAPSPSATTDAALPPE